MEEVILSIIVIIIFAIIQQASSNTVHEKKTFTVPQSPLHASDTSTKDVRVSDIEICDMPQDHEMRLLDMFQKNTTEGKRELLVYELREICDQHDTTTFFEKYPEVHRYIFNMP